MDYCIAWCYEDSEDDVVYLNKIAPDAYLWRCRRKDEFKVLWILKVKWSSVKFTLFAQTKKATDHHLF